jgi:thioredoxin 1
VLIYCIYIPFIQYANCGTHRLSETFGDKAHFIQIDVDELPEVAQELGIRAMPTFKVFKDGEPSDSLVGAVPAKLEALVANAVKDV